MAFAMPAIIKKAKKTLIGQKEKKNWKNSAISLEKRKALMS